MGKKCNCVKREPSMQKNTNMSLQVYFCELLPLSNYSVKVNNEMGLDFLSKSFVK